jgi:signal peptidase I
MSSAPATSSWQLALGGAIVFRPELPQIMTPPTPAAPPLAARKSAVPGKSSPAEDPKHHWLRQMGDELFFVFIMVMFFKLFLVDLYKIPTGSMTPTLIGGMVADLDINGDRKKDLAYWSREDRDDYTIQFFRQPDGTLAAPEPPRADVSHMNDPRIAAYSESLSWRNARLPYRRYDRILVNKLGFWFHQPRRGQIVVFKVPESIWKMEAPIYIKRLAGEPGDLLTFDPHGRLIANGQLVETPPFYKTQYYSNVIEFGQQGTNEFPGNTYAPSIESPVKRLLTSIHVPTDEAYVFGDNTLGSFDSRYWGGVPLENFKGRAFFRVYPFSVLGFLK